MVARGGWTLPATASLFVDHLLATGEFRTEARDSSHEGVLVDTGS